MTPITRAHLRLVGAFIAVLLAVALLAAGLHHSRPHVAQWVAAARHAQLVHLRLQLQLAQRLDEQAAVAAVQATCGPETGWLPRADGAQDCTDKRGRRTGQQLTGAHP